VGEHKKKATQISQLQSNRTRSHSQNQSPWSCLAVDSRSPN